jgi:hypothetical protein
MADYNVVLGSSTADSLIVSNTSGTDSLALLAGNDTVTGSGGIDVIDFGSGNDLLTQPGAYTGGTVLGGSGNDTIYSAAKASGTLFNGQSNNDSIDFSNSSATFSALTISGGLANDTITLKSGTTLSASSVYGGSSTVTALDSADSISVGTSSSSFLQGNAGNDTFNIAKKLTSSTVKGGKDNDFISQVGAVKGSVVTGDVGSDTFLFTGNFAGNSSVYGGSLSDTTNDSKDSLAFSGNFENSFLQANAGNDTIGFVGTISGNSTVKGGKGNDFVTTSGALSQGVMSGDLGADTLVLAAAVSQSSVYGGNLVDTTTDGADSLAFMGGASQTFVQGNAGADTVYFGVASQQTTIKGGAGNDSIDVAGGGAALKVEADLGNDTLNFAVSSDSTFDAGAGNNYISGSGVLTTSSVFGGASSDTLELTANTGKYYAKGGNDSLYLTMTSGTVFGGSSAGDTAAGNDTLDIVSMAGGRIDVGGGTNRMEASASIEAGTIVAGAGNDTFSTASDFGSASDTRIGTGAGNDSLYFSGNVSSTATVINLGAGNDQLQFTTLVSSASIIGGTGNDSLAFTRAAGIRATVAEGNQYFYGGGTDTLFFTGDTSNTALMLNVNVLDSLYTSVATSIVAGTGMNVVGTVTSGGTSTSTTIAYVLGASNGSNITVSEVSQATIDTVSSLG